MSSHLSPAQCTTCREGQSAERTRERVLFIAMPPPTHPLTHLFISHALRARESAILFSFANLSHSRVPDSTLFRCRYCIGRVLRSQALVLSIRWQLIPGAAKLWRGFQIPVPVACSSCCVVPCLFVLLPISTGRCAEKECADPYL